MAYLSPDIAFNRLDLPAPLGPIIALKLPFLNTPLTPCKRHFFFESVTVNKYTKKSFFTTISNCFGLITTNARSERIHNNSLILSDKSAK